MRAVLTITGRIDVLGKETESQVEMGTVGSVRGVPLGRKQRATS